MQSVVKKAGTAKKATSPDMYEIITNRIIEQLEKGVIPWRKTWNSYGLAKNYVTGKPYRRKPSHNLYFATNLKSKIWGFAPIYIKYSRIHLREKKVIEKKKVRLLI